MTIRSLSAFPCQFVSASLSSVLGMGLVIGTAFLEPMVSAAENSTNRLVTYKDEGRIHFALSLLATKDLTPVGSPLVAVVVDPLRTGCRHRLKTWAAEQTDRHQFVPKRI